MSDLCVKLYSSNPIIKISLNEKDFYRTVAISNRR